MLLDKLETYGGIDVSFVRNQKKGIVEEKKVNTKSGIIEIRKALRNFKLDK